MQLLLGAAGQFAHRSLNCQKMEVDADIIVSIGSVMRIVLENKLQTMKDSNLGKD